MSFPSIRAEIAAIVIAGPGRRMGSFGMQERRCRADRVSDRSSDQGSNCTNE
jgi:hypothetical protein